MKIQAIKKCSTPSGALLPGDVADVETIHGEYLVAEGYAKPHGQAPPKVERVETATAPLAAAQNAMVKTGKRR